MVYGNSHFFHAASEGAERCWNQDPFKQNPYGEALSYPFFCTYSLLIHLQGDPGVKVSQQLLGPAAEA